MFINKIVWIRSFVGCNFSIICDLSFKEDNSIWVSNKFYILCRKSESVPIPNDSSVDWMYLCMYAYMCIQLQCRHVHIWDKKTDSYFHVVVRHAPSWTFSIIFPTSSEDRRKYQGHIRGYSKEPVDFRMCRMKHEIKSQYLTCYHEQNRLDPTRSVSIRSDPNRSNPSRTD